MYIKIYTKKKEADKQPLIIKPTYEILELHS